MVAVSLITDQLLRRNVVLLWQILLTRMNTMINLVLIRIHHMIWNIVWSVILIHIMILAWSLSTHQ